MNIEQLNKEFGIADQVVFTVGQGGFPYIEVSSGLGRALLSVYAGQVLSYRPANASEDLLFLSDKAYYQAGKAIKGGIPICWPWFGPDPAGRGGPAHGFVRNRHWHVIGTEMLPAGELQIRLALQHTAETQAIWPHPFALQLVVTVGATLKLELVTQNPGTQDFLITQALHSYFRVGDIAGIKVLGLNGNDYLDKVDEGRQKSQSGEVNITTEVDRIYTDTGGELVIDDPDLQRRISITSGGSRTTVVWNPWSEIAVQMSDLDDQDYRRFVCVETANAADDQVKLAPGGEYRLSAEYRIEAYD